MDGGGHLWPGCLAAILCILMLSYSSKPCTCSVLKSLAFYANGNLIIEPNFTFVIKIMLRRPRGVFALSACPVICYNYNHQH